SLVLNYGTPVPVTFGEVAPFALAIGLLLIATVVALARWPKVGFLGAWFFITLAPTSSFVPIATEVGAERRMYLPLIALVLLSLFGSRTLLTLVARRVSRAPGGVPPSRTVTIVSTIALIIVSTALSAATITRNRDYSSSLSLARTVLERYPTSVAHHMVGAELSMAGQHEQAEAELRRALPGAPRAHYALGVELFRQGKLDEAIDELQLFIKEQPLLLEVLSARDLIGQIFAQKQQWGRAAEQYRALVTMAPS